MRNLRNLQHQVLSRSQGPKPSSCAWDVASNNIIYAFGPSETDSLIELRKWSSEISNEGSSSDNSEHLASWDAPCPNPDLPCDRVLDIHHFPDRNDTCIILAGGDIVNVSAAAAEDGQQIEIVGSVDAGIAAAAWSPDEELLVILTNADTFLYMTRGFDNIVNVDLSVDDLKASKHVSVGWGKAETQFRGKGAKALRDPTVPEKVDEGLFSSKDRRESTISWRGDGAYVAVNSPLASNRRVIRIYSREGELDSVSSPVDYMESALSWRPAGNLIASIQRLEDRVDVIFFERNGLRHGQFSLRLSKEEMDSLGAKIDLHWNIDSSVLAVCFLDRLQLWTMGNYHYYLKQEIRLGDASPEQHLPYFSWHPDQALLFTVGQEGSIQRYQYGWRVASGSKVPPNDYGLVSVIDGTRLKITPLRISNIPPPMSLAEISVESSIVDVSYLDAKFPDSSFTLLAVLDQGTVSVFQWNVRAKASEAPLMVACYQLHLLNNLSNMSSSLYIPRQIAFVDHETLLVLGSVGKEDHLTTLKLAQENLTVTSTERWGYVTEFVSISTDTIDFPYAWHNSCLTPVGSGISSKGKLGTTLPLGEYHRGKITDVPARAESVILARLNHSTSGDETGAKHILFSLERNGTLFANKRCIARGCTSFLATASHLIFTTSQHLLKFVHLADVDELEIPGDTPEIDERCRSVERGARLVTVIPSTSALVLQMPRGNLETIYPRALVLPLIRKSINEDKYKKAFLVCRTHRVDMNILHDHAPEKFLRSVDLFIDQIQKVEHIDLFLSQLQEEDVSKTMYKDTIAKQHVHVNGHKVSPSESRGKASEASKVNRICDAFLQALSPRIATNLQNKVTAHVCKNPPNLEAGLLEVAAIRKDSLDDGEKAVEHICFLADVNRLYDTALGLYDLDLTLQIAQQSQKDPREYIPFLQKLKDQEPLRMMVDTDNYLGRFSKVLGHLQELDEFEAFKTHMVKHNLYDKALTLCRYQENRIKDVMQLYAEYLRKNSRHKDAGLAYEFLLDYEAASDSYRLAHLWQEALTCASLVPFDESKLRAFAKSIADSQAELKDYRSAAIIFIDHLDNVEEATRMFCKGYYFADATRLISLHRKPELLQSVVDTGLAEGQATMTEMLAECKSQLNAQVPRLRELRVKKAEEPLAFLDANINGGADIPDNVSLAATDASTTGGTLFTRYTNRTGTVGTNATRKTSKNRRREERKRAMGKKGSIYEEEYLVNSIARLIERVNSIGEDVERLMMGLLRRGMRERARAVEAAMVTVVDLCKEHVDEVFQVPEKPQAEQDHSDLPEYRPTGGDAVLLNSMEETRTPKEPPVVKDFRKLSLLGN